MIPLGGNIYVWGWAAQNRLLVDCLGPAVRELRAEGSAEIFWFDRFDARGPHVFFLLSVPGEDFVEIRDQLADRLRSFLVEFPSREEIPVKDLAEMHRQTRGKFLCTADKLPGFEPNNSFILFEHALEGYPFHLTTHLRDEASYWRLIEAFSLWTIRQLETQPQSGAVGAGVRWAAALDRALRKAGVERDYWRFHASTLILGLEKRLAIAEREVLRALGRAVGEKNREIFDRVWSEIESSSAPWPGLTELVEVSLSGSRPNQGFLPLREAAHCIWKQLGMPTQQHIPLVLFALDRSLR